MQLSVTQPPWWLKRLIRMELEIKLEKGLERYQAWFPHVALERTYVDSVYREAV